MIAAKQLMFSSRIPVNNAISPYTILPVNGEHTFLVDASAGAVTINFPTAVGNKAKYNIIKTDSSANLVTLDAFGTQTVNGQLTIDIRFQRTCVSIISDNSNLLFI